MNFVVIQLLLVICIVIIVYFKAFDNSNIYLYYIIYSIKNNLNTSKNLIKRKQ